MGFPNLPGIPPLQTNPAGVITAVAGPTLSNALDSLKPSKWGFFDSTGKTAVLTPDSVLSFDYRESRNVAHYPLEDGGFESYNKVIEPAEADFKVIKTGTEKAKDDFLNTVKSMVADTNKYTLMTPNATYKNFNLTNYGYRRAVKDGAYILIVSLHFVEVLSAKVTKNTPAQSTTATPSATGTGSASSQSIVQNGVVNPSQFMPSVLPPIM